jgi:hypothetical protein
LSRASANLAIFDALADPRHEAEDDEEGEAQLAEA